MTGLKAMAFWATRGAGEALAQGVVPAGAPPNWGAVIDPFGGYPCIFEKHWCVRCARVR
jgi:hypothetical protein